MDVIESKPFLIQWGPITEKQSALFRALYGDGRKGATINFYTPDSKKLGLPKDPEKVMDFLKSFHGRFFFFNGEDVSEDILTRIRESEIPHAVLNNDGDGMFFNIGIGDEEFTSSDMIRIMTVPVLATV